MVRSRLSALILLAACAASCRGALADTVLLDFTQASCPPCVEMEPVLQQLAQEGVQIQRIDLHRQPQVAARYRVDVTPTYIVLVDGKEWARVMGVTRHPVMTEMIAKAQSLAAAEADRAAQSRNGGSVAPIDFHIPEAGVGPSATHTVAAGPQDGRVVPIQDPFAVRTPPRAETAATTGPSMAAAAFAGAPTAAGVDAAHLIAATVRLRVTDPQGKSTGTGAIVDARNGMALVLTCGHLFRESQGQGAIEISIFAAGPHGAELRGTVEGELFDYDLERDLALVRFRTESPVEVTPIAPQGTLLLPGAPVTSVGCNHGDNPTAVATTIKSINRYQGYPNVEIVGAPVEGRSGGGLFNAQGQLVGVCFAADPESDEGLYSALKSIHDKLDSLQLAAVYQSPSVGGTQQTAAQPGNQLAAAAAPDMAIRGQNPTPPSNSLAASLPDPFGRGATATGPDAVGPVQQPSAADAAALAASLTLQEQATLEEIARRSGGGEVICIIRPQSPEGRSDVIKLSGVSPAFVRALTSSAQDAAIQTSGPTAPAMAAVPGGALR